MKDFIRAYSRHKGGAVGLLVLLGVAALAVLAPWLYPDSPWDITGAPFAPPLSTEALLGTDLLGRDVAAGIVHGARVSLMLAVISTVVAGVFGTFLGALSGYFGGKVDQVIMGFTELFQTVPAFLLAVVLCGVFTPTMATTVCTVAVVSWPPLARLVRAEFMSLRTREFVLAAMLSGQQSLRIIVSQILPNSLSPIIVSSSLMVASAILLESALSFLGLGDPNVMSWGFIIGASRSVFRDAWWMTTFPGLAIMITVLALNLVGEALNDALNPKLALRKAQP